MPEQVPANKFLFAGTVPANNLFLKSKPRKVENKMGRLPLANFCPPEQMLFACHMTALDDLMEDFLASVDDLCVRHEADLGEEN